MKEWRLWGWPSCNSHWCFLSPHLLSFARHSHNIVGVNNYLGEKRERGCELPLWERQNCCRCWWRSLAASTGMRANSAYLIIKTPQHHGIRLQYTARRNISSSICHTYDPHSCLYFSLSWQDISALYTRTLNLQSPWHRLKSLKLVLIYHLCQPSHSSAIIAAGRHSNLPRLLNSIANQYTYLLNAKCAKGNLST